ncbi:MAG: ferredoxin:thioredoxin reductase [Planctomycetes bacterium]|nr:ferredoxin:thioredoxin reductase [Planctomycetota bacterium]
MDTVERAATIRSRLEEYLVGKSFYFNPDTEMVDSILKAMSKRWEQYGEDYCPCRRVTGDKEKDAKIICPCVYHVAEIAAQGFCHCRLFTRF